MYNNGRFYGNSSAGFGYSPDRSRDVDRFNPSTRGNYSTAYNPSGYYSPNRSHDVDRYNTSTATCYARRFPAADLLGR